MFKPNKFAFQSVTWAKRQVATNVSSHQDSGGTHVPALDRQASCDRVVALFV